MIIQSATSKNKKKTIIDKYKIKIIWKSVSDNYKMS
jgi:hypothetical protein